MIPKEKAIELVDRFKIGDVVVEKGGANQIVNINAYAKLFALIAVDELIESFNSIYDASIRNIEKYSGAKYGMKDYWQEVKQEIELL